ncbi:MAG TPA: sigma-70 family RNA polymerase sigma factor [Candidatus Limnocylindria bacterium]|nr:sigma-70 family RNA polymerase sigma factor [Candidatus Limnocylindria bacterium]
MELGERLSRDLDGNFMELVTLHQDLVFGVALRVVRRPADAEDVAQEAFVRAYRALSRYPAERVRELKLRPWLARIALNQARNWLRGRPTDAELDQAAESRAVVGNEPVRLAVRREERRFWQALLDELPPRYRLPVALRHVEGLSYAELAQTLERPVGTVKSDVHRGVRLLRAAYERAEQNNRQREAV